MIFTQPSGGSVSIGSPLSGATEGSIVFAGVGGILAEDNAGFFWDDALNLLKLVTTGDAIQILNSTNVVLEDTLPNGDPNPETKAQFRARKIKEYIKDITRSEERKAALAAVQDPTVED